MRIYNQSKTTWQPKNTTAAAKTNLYNETDTPSFQKSFKKDVSFRTGPTEVQNENSPSNLMKDKSVKMIVPERLEKIESRELSSEELPHSGLFRSSSGLFTAARMLFKRLDPQIRNEVDEVGILRAEELAEFKKKRETMRSKRMEEEAKRLEEELRQTINDQVEEVQRIKSTRSFLNNEKDLVEEIEEDPEATEENSVDTQSDRGVEDASNITKSDAGQEEDPLLEDVLPGSPVAEENEVEDEAEPAPKVLDEAALEAKRLRKEQVLAEYEEYVRSQPERIQRYQPPAAPQLEKKEVFKVSALTADEILAKVNAVPAEKPVADFDVAEKVDEREMKWSSQDGIDGATALARIMGTSNSEAMENYQRPAKIVILFYSLFGRVDGLVKHFIEGIKQIPASRVDVFQVPETLKETELVERDAPMKSFYPVFDDSCLDTLREADGILFGFRAGDTGVPAQVQSLLDSVLLYSKDTALAGKLAGIFCVSANTDYATEAAVESLTRNFTQGGLIHIPLESHDSSNSSWGAGIFPPGNGRKSISASDIADAKSQGEYFATKVRKFIQ